MINNYENLAKIGLLARIFECENWKWINIEKHKESVPTYEEIKEAIEDLEKGAFKCKGWSESGRLAVRWDRDTKGFRYYLEI